MDVHVAVIEPYGNEESIARHTQLTKTILYTKIKSARIRLISKLSKEHFKA